MNIAVGTTSDQKITYLKQVIETIGITATILPSPVTSDVTDQPLSIEETKTGSINRAQKALDLHPESDFSVGIEVGYHSDKHSRYHMFCCVTVASDDHSPICCCSSKVLLPTYHQNILKQGKSLGDHVRDYKKDTDDPVTRFTRDLITFREPIIKEALRNCLIQFLNYEDYSDEQNK